MTTAGVSEHSSARQRPKNVICSDFMLHVNALKYVTVRTLGKKNRTLNQVGLVWGL